MTDLADTIETLAGNVFAFLCHQDPERAWAPGGTALALCARCTGVHAGAVLAVLALPFVPRRSSSGWLWFHGGLLLQMLLFGLQLAPQGMSLRTLSGQLFSIGAVYYLWLCPSARWLHPREEVDRAGGRTVLTYGFASLLGVAALQALLRIEAGVTAAVIDLLALLGLGVLTGLSAATILAIVLPQKKHALSRDTDG